MDLGRVVGVALNGVLFYTGNSEYDYDAFFPKAYGTNGTMITIDPDICLGST